MPKITDPRGLIIRVTVYDANVAIMLNTGFPDGKNNCDIDGMTKSIRTISYPSSDQPRNEPTAIFFCWFVRLTKFVAFGYI